MRVVVDKPDVDTCLTALVLGVSERDDIEIAPGGASQADLESPRVVCIEAGGSGQPDRGNFDHHGPSAPSETASQQALQVRGVAKPSLLRLVEYVAMVDGVSPGYRPHAPAELTLSGILSGMRLITGGDREQLLAGIAILHRVLELGIDPFAPMPDLPEWREYAHAKRHLLEAQHDLRADVHQYSARSGIVVGFLESDLPGSLGVVFREGCDVAIVRGLRFDPHVAPGLSKYTIAGRNGRRVEGLLAKLHELEPGWGGPSHGTIIASPRAGSALTSATILAVVLDSC